MECHRFKINIFMVENIVLWKVADSLQFIKKSPNGLLAVWEILEIVDLDRQRHSWSSISRREKGNNHNGVPGVHVPCPLWVVLSYKKVLGQEMMRYPINVKSPFLLLKPAGTQTKFHREQSFIGVFFLPSGPDDPIEILFQAWSKKPWRSHSCTDYEI